MLSADRLKLRFMTWARPWGSLHVVAPDLGINLISGVLLIFYRSHN